MGKINLSGVCFNQLLLSILQNLSSSNVSIIKKKFFLTSLYFSFSLSVSRLTKVNSAIPLAPVTGDQNILYFQGFSLEPVLNKIDKIGV